MLPDYNPQKAARLLGKATHPPRVILFGSYARGDTDDASDVDFLVTESEVRDLDTDMVRLSHLLQFLGIEANMRVYSSSEVEKQWGWCSGAAYWKMREGEGAVCNDLV